MVSVGMSLFFSTEQSEHIFQVSEKGYREYSTTNSLIDDLTSIHLTVVTLIRQKDMNQLEHQVEKFNKQRNEYAQKIASFFPSDKNLYEKYAVYNKQLEKNLTEFILMGKSSQATDFFILDLNKSFDEVANLLEKIQKRTNEHIISSLIQAKQDQKNSNFLIELIALCLVIFFLIFGIFISKRIKKNLNEALQNINATGITLEKSSSALGESSNQLSNSAVSSASSLEQTVASLEEVSSLVERNSEGAQRCAEISDRSLNLVNTGKLSIDELIVSIKAMQASSKKIEEIVNVIEDISFQTNLLALNAAVEAARAGEQGKGFAVVAEAVRSLAQRASISAKEISQLIHVASKDTENSSQLAIKGSGLFTDVLDSISKLNHIARDISEGSKDQSMGVKQISQVLNHLDTISQNNSKEAVETANTAQELSNQTKLLTESLNALSKLAG